MNAHVGDSATSADDRGITPGASERADLLGRITALDRRLKRTVTAERHRAELRAYREALDDLLHHLSELRRSESWRLGNGIVRVLRVPVVALGPLFAPGLRRWRSSRTNRDRRYRRAIAAGSPLASLDARASANSSTPAQGAIASFVQQLRMSRTDEPRVLEAEELAGLRRALASSSSEPELADRARRVLAPSERWDAGPTSSSAGTLIVVDARALQLAVECGTKTHAAHVVRALRAALPPTARMLMLTSTRLPEVAPGLAGLFAGRFVPGATPLEDVVGFVQLMVFSSANEDHDLELLRAPWVRRVAVWLDAIMGRYPSVFLGSDEEFLEYQLGIEKLGRADHVLVLSESSQAELPPNLDPAIRVTISGARPGVTDADADAATIDLPARPYCVLVGNSLPHKNVVTGVAAFLRSSCARRERMLLVVVATLDAGILAALHDFVRASGGDVDDLLFVQELPHSDLARLIKHAAAVILPSRDEGFSLPLVEALGLGTPVIASDIPAHRELLGRDEALADPRNPNEMARVLDDALAHSVDTLARQKDALRARYDPTRLERVASIVAAELVAPGSFQHATSRARGMAHVRTRTAPSEESLRRPALAHSKICNVEDFSHPDLMPVMREHFSHETARFGSQFPKGREWRKHWEIAMALRTFADAALLDGQHDFLGVGAGNEPTIFLLTRHARRVVATDLYLDAESADTADASMLTDPGWHWPFTWQPARLRVAHMDARRLELPDHSFHGIFSSSSIEHFGDRGAITAALDEMYRVLAPGGVLSISSEFRITGPPPGMPGVAMFDADEIDEVFVGGRAWSLVDPFDAAISATTLATSTDFDLAAADQQRQVEEFGGYFTHLIEFAMYPHVVLETSSHAFTSFHLALRKHE